ncbi:MAG TPA: hypothetical protein ENN73_06115, partial [Firmicutes bacterium]|nr:hypothetical protein [Bacillota bacterium]
INVMGATKLLGEKIITAATFYKGNKITKFCSVRFGNVLGSRGSVVPLFIDQIKSGGPVTVTDPEMTRFFMTIPDTVKLIFKATENCVGGEVFILKMPVIKVSDLVNALIEIYGKRFGKMPIKIIHDRPGEKKFEILLTEAESHYALETEDMYIILPHPEYKIKIDFTRYKYRNSKKVKIKKYDSQIKPLSKKFIKKLLNDLSIEH